MEEPNSSRLIDEMFRDLEAKGLRAIAHSNEETVRTELLALMQTLSNYKLKLHKALLGNSRDVDKVLMQGGELTEEVIAALGPKSEIIEITDKIDGDTK